MYSLLAHNTFGIDVNANSFLEYTSVEELKEFIANGIITYPFLHIGSGSNLLFTGNYEGLILHSQIHGINIIEETEHGAENLSLIPGEVGASAVQNIGAYGVEVKDLIDSVETVSIQGEKHIYPVAECGYTYRNSIFKLPENKSLFVTHVCFRLSKIESYTLDYGTIRQKLEQHSQPSLKVLRDIIVDIRKSKLPDPKVIGNAGSFFMNPMVTKAKLTTLLQTYPQMPYYDLGNGNVKIPAGWMIEQCGWKGRALGPAAVHDKQALVLVNRGGATGRDIVALSDAIRASVRTTFGIEIYPEVNII